MQTSPDIARIVMDPEELPDWRVDCGDTRTLPDGVGLFIRTPQREQDPLRDALIGYELTSFPLGLVPDHAKGGVIGQANTVARLLPIEPACVSFGSFNVSSGGRQQRRIYYEVRRTAPIEDSL